MGGGTAVGADDPPLGGNEPLAVDVRVEALGEAFERRPVAGVVCFVRQVDVNEFVSERRGGRGPPLVLELRPGEDDRFRVTVSVPDGTRTAFRPRAHFPGEVAHTDREVVFRDDRPGVHLRRGEKLLAGAVRRDGVSVWVDGRPADWSAGRESISVVGAGLSTSGGQR